MFPFSVFNYNLILNKGNLFSILGVGCFFIVALCQTKGMCVCEGIDPVSTELAAVETTTPAENSSLTGRNILLVGCAVLLVGATGYVIWFYLLPAIAPAAVAATPEKIYVYVNPYTNPYLNTPELRYQNRREPMWMYNGDPVINGYRGGTPINKPPVPPVPNGWWDSLTHWAAGTKPAAPRLIDCFWGWWGPDGVWVDYPGGPTAALKHAAALKQAATAVVQVVAETPPGVS